MVVESKKITGLQAICCASCLLERARAGGRPVSAVFAMACACFLPSCRICSGGGGGPTAVAHEHGGACTCLLPSCKQCSMEVAGVGMCVGTAGMDAVVPQGPAGIDAVRPQCMCLMADCVTCQGVTVAAAIGPKAHQRKRKRKQKRELPPGHSKCSLHEELDIDAGRHQGSCGHQARHVEMCAALCKAFMLLSQPMLSALEMIGRPRGECWDFFEVYSGCGNFTAAVCALGLVVGPAVDMLYKIGGLKLDCLLENSQALLQAVLEEARPHWVHVGPPCTFWCAIGRWSAHGTAEQWDTKRKKAKTHWCFALHLLSLQEARGAMGSLEQPPGCASWKLGLTQDFRAAYPTWKFYKFKSCPYGMKNPGTGEPWEKWQGFLSNVSLAEMHAPCVCTMKHGHIQGIVKGGPRHGERCSTVAGAYTPDMCSALATIVQKAVPVRGCGQ